MLFMVEDGTFWKEQRPADQKGACTSWRPPEQARERGVSLVRSDWASMSPPLSRRTSTTPTWPAVAARMRGVKPGESRESGGRSDWRARPDILLLTKLLSVLIRNQSENPVCECVCVSVCECV